MWVRIIRSFYQDRSKQNFQIMFGPQTNEINLGKQIKSKKMQGENKKLVTK